MNTPVEAELRFQWLNKCKGIIKTPIAGSCAVTIKYPEGSEYTLHYDDEKWELFKEVYKELCQKYPSRGSAVCILWAFDIVLFNQFIPDWLSEKGGTESWH